MYRIFIALFLFISTHSFSQKLSKSTERKISHLMSGTHTGSSFRIVEYYTNALLDDIKSDLELTSDSAAKAYLLEEVIRKKLKFNFDSTVLAAELERLITEQQLRVSNFNVEYGDLLRAFKVRNGDIEFVPSQVLRQYTFSNQKLFDTIAKTVSRYTDNYFLAHLKDLEKSTATEAERILLEGIRAARPEALTQFFKSLEDKVRAESGLVLSKGKAAFDSLKASFYTISSEAGGLWSQIIQSAHKLKYDAASKVLNQIDKVTSDLKNYGKDFIASKLAQLSRYDETLFKKIAAFDQGAIRSFLAELERKTVEQFDSTVRDRLALVKDAQKKFEEKIIKNRQVITDQLDHLLTQAQSFSFADLRLEDYEKGFEKAVNLLPAVSERILQMENYLKNGQELFKSGIRKFYDTYAKDVEHKAEAVLFLASFFTDTKPASDFIREIKGSIGVGESLSDFDQAKMELVNIKESFVNDASDFLKTGGMIVSSLQVLGIGNDKLMADISEGIRIAEGVINIAGSIASGNIFGAISGLTGLFGGGSDPAAERHKQVMAALKRIDAKLDIMDKKLDAILANQKAMFELQQETYKEVRTLTETVIKEFDKVNQSLLDIQLSLNFLVTKEFQNSAGNCISVAKNIGRLSSDEDQVENYVVDRLSHEKIRTTLRGFHRSVIDEAEQLFSQPKNRLIISGAFNPLFEAKIYDNAVAGDGIVPDSVKMDFTKNWSTYYQDLLAFSKTSLNNSVIEDKSVKTFLARLIAPVFTYKEYIYKNSFPAFNLNSTSLIHNDVHCLDKLMSTRAASIYAQCVLLFHPVVVLTDNESRRIEPNEKFFSNIEDRMPIAEGYLMEVLRTINTAIAQQSLLAGDMVLEEMRLSYDSLLAKPDTQRLKRLNAFLTQPYGNNLYDNFIRYFILKELEESGRNGSAQLSLRGYSTAFGFKQEKLMNELTVKWPFPVKYITASEQKELKAKRVQVDTGWHCKIDDVYKRLPHPTELESLDGFKLKYSQDMFKLLEYREQLVNAIEEYVLYRSSKTDDRKLLNYVGVLAYPVTN